MSRLIRFAEWLGYHVGYAVAWPLDRFMHLDATELPLLQPQEEPAMQYAIQCWGGPKDGHSEVLIRSRRPEMVFVWHAQDDKRMDRAQGEAYEALRARLGIFAYRFDRVVAKEGKPDHREFVYVYCPKRNKRSKGNADKGASQPKL